MAVMGSEEQMRQLFRKITLAPEAFRNGEHIFDIVKSVMVPGLSGASGLTAVSNLTFLLIQNWSSVLRLLKTGLDEAVKNFMALFRKAKGFFEDIWHWLIASWEELWK